MTFLNASSQRASLGLVLFAVALVLAPWIVGHAGGNTWVRTLDFALLYIMLALGLNIVVGYAGLLDMGLIAFYAVGAYLAALLSSPDLLQQVPALMALLYFVGAYAAALAAFLFTRPSTIPIVGARGAISAIVRAYALLFARNRVDPVGPIPGSVVRIIWLTLAWIGIQLMIGIATRGNLNGIAIYAHIGGFVAGLLLTRPLLEWRFRSA